MGKMGANLSHRHLFKIVKKMESKDLILLQSVGNGKTSAFEIKLNWENPLIEKMLTVALTEEALQNQRWMINFKELENKVDFTMVFGSVLHSPKEANDIDLLVISGKNKFIEIENEIIKMQKTQPKRVHSTSMTPKELTGELKKRNKALLDAIQKGVIIHGQERFIKIMGEVL